jgi:hypothetical protein
MNAEKVQVIACAFFLNNFQSFPLRPRDVSGFFVTCS